jgi:hypothetical protein
MAAIASAFNSDLFYSTEPLQLVSIKPKITLSSSRNAVSCVYVGQPADDAILVFTPTGMESTFATGLNNPHGLAFDVAGNLFVAETLRDAGGDILEFTTGGGEIVFASGLNRPENLTFGPPR